MWMRNEKINKTQERAVNQRRKYFFKDKTIRILIRKPNIWLTELNAVKELPKTYKRISRTDLKKRSFHIQMAQHVQSTINEKIPKRYKILQIHGNLKAERSNKNHQRSEQEWVDNEFPGSYKTKGQSLQSAGGIISTVSLDWGQNKNIYKQRASKVLLAMYHFSGRVWEGAPLQWRKKPKGKTWDLGKHRLKEAKGCPRVFRAHTV